VEFNIKRFALLWEAPNDCDRSDIDRLIDWVRLVMGNVEEISTILVDLHGVPAEHYDKVWCVVEYLGWQFGFRPLKFFREEGKIYVNDVNGKATEFDHLHQPLFQDRPEIIEFPLAMAA
jgi:hypothetical protein